MTTTALTAPRDPFKIVLRDMWGNKLKPGAVKDAEDVEFNVEVSALEVVLNNLLVAVDGTLQALYRVLGFGRNLAVKPAGGADYSHQANIDTACDGAFMMLRDQAEIAYRRASRVRTDDVELQAARAMLREYVLLLRKVNWRKDCAPGIDLAWQFRICLYRMTTSRAGDLDRLQAVMDWRVAVAKAAKAIG